MCMYRLYYNIFDQIQFLCKKIHYLLIHQLIPQHYFFTITNNIYYQQLLLFYSFLHLIMHHFLFKNMFHFFDNNLLNLVLQLKNTHLLMKLKLIY
jgi:hypothetical protein